MTFQELEELVSKIRYKKMKFKLERPGYGPYELRNPGLLLESLVPCIFTGRDISISMQRSLPPVEQLSEDLALDLLFQFCCDFETHEVGEWFQVDGKRPFDPHLREPGHVSKPITTYTPVSARSDKWITHGDLVYDAIQTLSGRRK